MTQVSTGWHRLTHHPYPVSKVILNIWPTQQLFQLTSRKAWILPVGRAHFIRGSPLCSWRGTRVALRQRSLWWGWRGGCPLLDRSYAFSRGDLSRLPFSAQGTSLTWQAGGCFFLGLWDWNQAAGRVTTGQSEFSCSRLTRRHTAEREEQAFWAAAFRQKSLHRCERNSPAPTPTPNNSMSVFVGS